MTNQIHVKLVSKVFIYILSLCFLGYEMAVQVLPSIISQQLSGDFHLGPQEIGLISGGYFITYGLMQLPAGVIYDFFSLRNVLLFSTSVCSLGIFLFASSNGLYTLISSRILMGLGSAFAFTATLVVPILFFPKKHFSFFVAITQLTACFGAFGGQFMLSKLLGHSSWIGVSYGLSITGVALVVLIFLLVPQTLTTLKTPIRFKLMLQTLRFVIKSKQNWYCALYAFALWAPMGAFASLWGVNYLQIKYDTSLSAAALLCGYTWIGLGLGSILISLKFRSTENKRILLTCLASLGLLTLLSILFINIPQMWLLSIILFTLGVSCVGQLITFEYIHHNNPQQQVASAIGFNNMFIVCSSLFMQPLVGFIIDSSVFTTAPDLTKYTIGLSPLLGLLVMAALLSLCLIRKITPK